MTGLRNVLLLLIRTFRQARDDRIVGVAAQVAFFALLSIPPFLLVVAGLAGYLDVLLGPDARDAAKDWIIDGLGGFLARETMDGLVRPAVEGIFAEGRGGIVSVGAVVAVWSASRLIRVLIESLNITYGVQEWRPAWKRRLMAVGLTVGGLVVATVLLPFIVAGPRFGGAIDERFGLGGVLGAVWPVLYWPVAVGIGVLALASLYHVAPNRRTPWLRDVPGAALAAALWLAAAVALRFYVRFSVTERELGPLAAPVVLLLWFYVSALAVLLGAGFNAEIEKRRPATTETGAEE